MLIRSQDKMVIVNLDINNLYISSRAGGYVIFAENTNEPYNLGTYSSEEKAIKVLSNIIKHNDNIALSKFYGYTKSHYVSSYFDMPKD